MNFLKKNKKFFVIFSIIICLILSILSLDRLKPSLFENSIGIVLSPIQNFITSSITWIKDKSKSMSDINQIVDENNTLKLELELASQEIKRLNHLKIENEKLTGLLKTSSRYQEYSTITADIIAKDPSNLYENFTINKGSKDGITKNMVVLADGGLVGKVEEVGYNYSKISSIINGTYSVTSKTLRTDDEGFVKGNITDKGTCKMEYIDKDADIKEGDEIITSHLSTIYPPGISIGYVTEVSLDVNNKLSKTAIIEPFVDFIHLDKVLIINIPNNTKVINTETTIIEPTTESTTQPTTNNF